MRILHIDTGRELRGGQRQVLLLMSGLRDAGHECLLLAEVDTPLWNAAHSIGFTTIKASVSSVKQTEKRADILHAHDAHAHTLTAIGCRNRPFVVSRRVIFPIKRGWLSRLKYKRPTRYLAISDAVAKALEEAGIERTVIDVVPDGVDVSSRPPSRPLGDRIVALGSKDPAKGRDLVEEAERRLETPVLYSDNLAKDLREAAVFVYITRSEGFGSAALLAMSVGVPVVASRVGGLPELLADAGLLVENDPEEIAAAVRLLMQDSELTIHLRSQGWERAKTNFSKTLLVQRTLQSYARALAG